MLMGVAKLLGGRDGQRRKGGARCGETFDQMVAAVASHARATMSKFNARDLTNLVWALAQMYGNGDDGEDGDRDRVRKDVRALLEAAVSQATALVESGRLGDSVQAVDTTTGDGGDAGRIGEPEKDNKNKNNVKVAAKEAFNAQEMLKLVVALNKFVNLPDFGNAQGRGRGGGGTDAKEAGVEEDTSFDAVGNAMHQLIRKLEGRRQLRYSFPLLSRGASDVTSRWKWKEGEEEGEDEEDGGEIVLESAMPGRHSKGTGVAAWQATFVLADLLTRMAAEPALYGSVWALLSGASHSRVAAVERWTERIRGGGGPWRGKRGVELGAGLGLPSIVAAALGMDVVATDGDEAVLELLSANAAANTGVGDRAGRDGKGEEGRGGGRVHVARLLWGDSETPLEDVGFATGQEKEEGGGGGGESSRSCPPDLVLAADVVYGNDEPTWEALVATLGRVCGVGTLVLFANMRRFKEGEERFLALMGRYFEGVAVAQHLLHPDHRRGGPGSCAVHAFRFKGGGVVPPLPEFAPQIRSRQRGKRKKGVERGGDGTSSAAEHAEGVTEKHRKGKKRESEVQGCVEVGDGATEGDGYGAAKKKMKGEKGRRKRHLPGEVGKTKRSSKEERGAVEEEDEGKRRNKKKKKRKKTRGDDKDDKKESKTRKKSKKKSEKKRKKGE